MYSIFCIIINYLNQDSCKDNIRDSTIEILIVGRMVRRVREEVDGDNSINKKTSREPTFNYYVDVEHF